MRHPVRNNQPSGFGWMRTSSFPVLVRARESLLGDVGGILALGNRQCHGSFQPWPVLAVEAYELSRTPGCRASQT